MTASNQVCLGVITGAVGVRGEVRIKPYTAHPLDVASYGPVTTKEGASFKLSNVKTSKGGISAKLAGIEDRDAASAMRGVELFVDRAKLPAPQEEEFYYVDLIGMDVETSGGEKVGTVNSVHDFGAGDLLEVALWASDRSKSETVFVPFRKEVVVDVRLAEGRIVIDPPDGLLSALDDESGDEPDDEKV